MATPTTSRSRPPLDSPSGSRGRGRALLRLAVVVVVGVFLLAAGSLLGLRLARSGALPGVTVDGVVVGGLSHGAVADRLDRLAARKSAAEIVAVRDEGQYAGTAETLGYSMDVESTVEQVMYRGRQGNPLLALADHLRAFRTTIDIPPVEEVDEEALSAWAEKAARRLERDPREGRLRFDGDQIRRVDPRDGAIIDPEDLAGRARALVVSGAGGTVDVTIDPIEPTTTVEDVDAVLAEAEQALSAPVTFSRSGASATLSPAQIGDALRTRLTDDGIELVVKPDEVRAAFGDAAIASFESNPQSARFEISGGNIRLVEGSNGFAYDNDAAADQLLEVATGDGPREVTLKGEILKADLTTKQARNLGIKEKVSEFTTHHACCESRVTNIHRMADIVDDVLVKPGETFSVNGFVGERTKEKGFVEGGAIFEGEFIEDVGGGVSQFATTTYNAAFFGGYEIVEHKAHSYYISRYPVGREATLDYPNVDLKIRNNSPHGMVISTSYTDTSITVAMYGTKWVKVTTTTGERTNLTEPTTIYKENDDLPKGSQRVVQEAGSGGFDIVVTRTLRFPNGETKREEIFTRYLAQPRIIERNT